MKMPDPDQDGSAFAGVLLSLCVCVFVCCIVLCVLYVCIVVCSV